MPWNGLTGRWPVHFAWGPNLVSVRVALSAEVLAATWEWIGYPPVDLIQWARPTNDNHPRKVHP